MKIFFLSIFLLFFSFERSFGNHFTQQQILFNSSFMSFGSIVFSKGNNLLISISDSTNQGAVLYFVNDTGDYLFQYRFFDSQGTTNEYFGNSISMDSNFVAIGAPGDSGQKGAVFLFEGSQSTWAMKQKLTSSDSLLGDGFGTSVSIYLDVLIVGVPNKNSSDGAVYIFLNNGTFWNLHTELLTPYGSGSSSAFGTSVISLNNTVFIGAPFTIQLFTNYAGFVAIYTLAANNTWILQQSLSGTAAPSSQYGVFLSFDFSSLELVVSCPMDNLGSVTVGSVFVYKTNGFSWYLNQKLYPATNATTNLRFGTSTTISGNNLVVAAFPSAQLVFVFNYNGSNWVQTQVIGHPSSLDSNFGSSVSLSGNILYISDNAYNTTGAVFIFSTPLIITGMQTTQLQTTGTQITGTQLTTGTQITSKQLTTGTQITSKQLTTGTQITSKQLSGSQITSKQLTTGTQITSNFSVSSSTKKFPHFFCIILSLLLLFKNL